MQRPTFLHSNNKGFTLVEAMVVVAIVATLIGFSYTGLSGTLGRQRCQAAAQKIAWVLKQAQMQAVEKHAHLNVMVTPGDDNVTIQTDNGTVVEKVKIAQEFKGVDVISGAQFYFSTRGIPKGTYPKIQLRLKNSPGPDGNVTVSSMGRITIAMPNSWQY